MLFTERAEALRPFGYDEVEAAFLATAALTRRSVTCLTMDLIVISSVALLRCCCRPTLCGKVPVQDLFPCPDERTRA